MRYRRLDASGDMVFGYGQADFYVNQPEAVAQAVLTRLRLFTGEWFIDNTDGMDWSGSVLGNNTRSIRDAVIKSRILDTPGVKSIVGYQSTFDRATRKFSVAVVLNTIYGVFPTQNGSVSTATNSLSNITGVISTGSTTTSSGATQGVVGSGMPPPVNSGLTLAPAVFATASGAAKGTVVIFTLDQPGADILDAGEVLG